MEFSLQGGLVLLGDLALSGAVRLRVSARLLLGALGHLLRIVGTPRKSVSTFLSLSAERVFNSTDVWSAWTQAVPVARRRAASGCTVAVGWCAGVARLGARSTWEGAAALWRLTGADASIGAGSLISSGGEVFSLLATGTSAMGAAALEALVSEMTAILLVVVWVCLR